MRHFKTDYTTYNGVNPRSSYYLGPVDNPAYITTSNTGTPYPIQISGLPTQYPPQTVDPAALRDLEAAINTLCKENPMPVTLDQVAITKLNEMRVARDKAAEYRENLNDEAFQLELQAQAKRALASYMTTEINEGVPVADDEVVNAVTTTSNATAASK